MKKQRELIATYTVTEMGKTYNVYEYFGEDGKKHSSIKPSGSFIFLNNSQRNSLEGIIKKTDLGIKICLEKLSSPLYTDSEKGRYINQLRHHTNVFIKDYLYRIEKDMDQEETVIKVSEKLNNVIQQFIADHPNVEIEDLLKELLQNDILKSEKILFESIKILLNNFQTTSENE